MQLIETGEEVVELTPWDYGMHNAQLTFVVGVSGSLDMGHFQSALQR
jgi:hypothetical protein